MAVLGAAMVFVATASLCAPQASRRRELAQDDHIQQLGLNTPVERSLAGGESHSYKIGLQAGQFCDTIVDQRGVDVVVAIYGLNGEKIVEVDAPNAANGPERISLIAETEGTYRLEVRSPDKSSPAGRYEIKMTELRASVVQDRSRIAAQKLCADAKALRNQRTAESQRQAVDKYQEALLLWQSLNDARLQAYTLNEMGLILDFLSEYQKALEAYARARSLYEAIGDSRGRAGMLNNIGVVYASLGEHQKALDYYEQTLRAMSEIGDTVEPRFLSNMGAEYASVGEYQKALDIHLQVLSIRRTAQDHGGQAITLNNIANCYEHLGDRQKALDYYNQALAKMPSVGNVFYTATVLNHIGAVWRDLGNYQKAIEYLGQALQIRRTIGDQSGQAATLFEMARLGREKGNLDEARKNIDSALAAVESLRTRVLSPNLRASLFASVRQYHEFNIDLLMRLHEQRPSEGFDVQAFQASERARARSLLDLLTESRAEIRQGVDPDLLARESSLRQSLSDKAERQTRLLSSKHTEDQATAAAREIDALTADYDHIESQIRELSPRYAELTRPSILTVKEIQKDLLDDDTLLLEYALGEERSFLWAVTPGSITTVSLPARAKIETAARRIYDVLTARSLNIPGEAPQKRAARLARAYADYREASSSLGQMLLGPVTGQLAAKRLLVVGEGLLQYVPFAALTVRKDDNAPPLVVDHEIVSLPSASVLAALRADAAARKGSDRSIAVFADPVFSADDPRVRASIAGKSAPPTDDRLSQSEAKRSANESGLRDLVRLRFSRQEAETIARLAEAGKLVVTDFAASRGAATNPDLGRYGIIHFATHALINNQHPELSGVVLSLVDEQGLPQNGFLRLYDIYNLKLGADLVVLSACQTALGREIRGEGLMGLSRGFMYAGAPRVLATLWRIDDRATAELMGRFYEAILREKLRPAAALRAAQISMMKEKRWQEPYFWAAVTLQGEWK